MWGRRAFASSGLLSRVYCQLAMTPIVKPVLFEVRKQTRCFEVSLKYPVVELDKESRAIILAITSLNTRLSINQVSISWSNFFYTLLSIIFRQRDHTIGSLV